MSSEGKCVVMPTSRVETETCVVPVFPGKRN